MIFVAGFCPRGCGERLVLMPAGNVQCQGRACPDPYAVEDLLATPPVPGRCLMWADVSTQTEEIA